METIKRFISAVLLACLLLAITVPAVSAEENTPVTYQFGFRNTSGAANKTLKTETNVALGGTQGAACQYISISNNTTGTRWERATFAPRFKGDDEENRAWVAIQINVATKGTYDMVFNVFNTDTYGQGAAKVYVLTQDGYNKATQPYQLKLASTSHNLTLSENESIYNALYNNNAVLNAGTETTISGNGADYKAFTDVGIGKVTFPEAGNYVLLFESKGAFAPNVNDTYAFYLVSLTMRPVVQAAAVASSVRNGETQNYTSADELAEAIEAAKEGTKFTLLKDVTITETITLLDGVTLDLNGKTLNATIIANKGSSVTDGSTGSTGKIVGGFTAENTVGENELALYDGTTTRIVTCAVDDLGTNVVKTGDAVSSVYFRYSVTFDNKEAYQMIADAANDAKFTIGAELSFGGNRKDAELKNSTVVSDWAGTMAALQEGQEVTFYVCVTGFENLGPNTTGDLSVRLWTKGATGVQTYSDPVTYTIGG